MKAYFPTTEQNGAVPVAIYQCREEISLSGNPKAVVRVRIGAVLEKLHFQGVKRPLLRIFSPGDVLLRGALLPSNLNHLGSPIAIHHQDTQLDSFYPNNPKELFNYYRQALGSVHLQLANIITSGIHSHQTDTHKLVYLLVELADRLGQERRGDWVDLPVHLSIEEWAECAGISSSEAASILISLRKRRLLSIENKVLSIHLINMASMVSYPGEPHP